MDVGKTREEEWGSGGWRRGGAGELSCEGSFVVQYNALLLISKWQRQVSGQWRDYSRAGRVSGEELADLPQVIERLRANDTV